MRPLQLVFKGVFEPSEIRAVLAELAPMFGGVAPPLPAPLIEARPDRNGAKQCGLWSTSQGNTRLDSRIESADGTPREGFPYDQAHELAVEGISVSLEGMTLSPTLYELNFEIAGATPRQVLEVREQLLKSLADKGTESTSSYYICNLCEALIERGAPELARPFLARAVVEAQSSGASGGSARRLYRLARAQGVEAPAPIPASEEPLPPLDSDHMASVVVLVGNLKRVRRYLRAGLSDTQKGWLLASALREDKAKVLELLLAEAGLSSASLDEGIGRAISANNPASLRRMLDARASDTPLDAHLGSAATFSTPELVEILIDAGADPNAQLAHPWPDSRQRLWAGLKLDGFTPLLGAVHANRPDNVATLLRAGAEPNRLTLAYRMALDVALGLRHAELAQTLRGGGARQRQPEDLDLAGAIYVGDETRAAQCLAEADANERRRAFLAAARSGRGPWVEELLPDDADTRIEAARVCVAHEQPAAMRALAPHLATAILDDPASLLVRVEGEAFAELRRGRRLRRLVDVALGRKPQTCLELGPASSIEVVELGPGLGYLSELLAPPSRGRDRFREDLFRYYAKAIAHPHADASYWQPQQIAWTLGMWARAAAAMSKDLGLAPPSTEQVEGIAYQSKGRAEQAQARIVPTLALQRSSPFIGEWLAATAPDAAIARSVGPVLGQLIDELTRALGRFAMLEGPAHALVLVR